MCLYGCFRERLEFELVNWITQMGLPKFMFFLVIKYCSSLFFPQDMNAPFSMPLAQTAFNTNENLKLALIADAFQIS